jgi:eukaryotic-like serine/threonine-protein kinase
MTPLDVARLRASDDLVSALREEQIGRWTAGDRTPAEAFLSAFPELAFEDAQVLIVGEMLLRWDAGEAPDADEFAARFPTHADDLRAQFDLQGTLDGPLLPSPAPEAEPVDVPGYLITAELGKGRWATVYLARHLVLGRPVALKLFNPAAEVEPHFALRFLEEARILAKLDHPHIVRVYDSGAAGTRLFMALEYAPNGTLADRLKKGRLTVAEAVDVCTKLARAAGVAHRAGVVHRDIKPTNVLRNKHGEPLLADFGLAKDVAESIGLTAHGTTVGTPAYMAPEQARAEPGTLGPSADVYALAAVLYELITGTPPLIAKSVAQTFRMVQDDIPTPLREREPAVPKWLSDLVARCLDKNRDRRPQTGDALADALAAGELPTADAPAKRGWWKWW